MKYTKSHKIINEKILTFDLVTSLVSTLSLFLVQQRQVQDELTSVIGENSCSNFPEVASHIRSLLSIDSNAKYCPSQAKDDPLKGLWLIFIQN